MVNLPFLKKKSQQVLPGKGFDPTDRVREMASRGFSEPEMIDVLRREGFSPEEIDRALTTSLRMNVTGETGAIRQPLPQQSISNVPQNVEQNIMPTLTPSTQSLPQQPSQQETVLPQIPETSLPEDYYSGYSAEDYIDYAVQNRMSEIDSRFEEMEAKQKQIAAKIDDMSKKLEKMSQQKVPESAEFSSKIGHFTDTVTDIDSRIGALEKAFKETLPALIESVRTLSDLVQKMKKEE